MPEMLDTCIHAAKSGGQVLLQWLGKINAREKGPKDLVTEADHASQEVIRGIVCDRYPDHLFIGEEDITEEAASTSDVEAEFRWIVDPLDGTVNFVHGMPSFATSVAVARGDEVVAGCIFDPIADECFAAARGGGAQLNGNPISVSRCTALDEALVAASFSTAVARDSEEVKRFVEVLVECRALRRLGSAALNLGYLAAGRLDAYWASSVKSWDVAAGCLLVTEAGGSMTALDGGAFDLDNPHFAAAATPELHRSLFAALNRAAIA